MAAVLFIKNLIMFVLGALFQILLSVDGYSFQIQPESGWHCSA